MWKKMLAMVAIIGLLFCAAPAMAGIEFGYSFGFAHANIQMFQLGAAGNAMYATPDFVLMANGTAGLQAMEMSTYAMNGMAGACALQVQGGYASQTLSGKGFTLTQTAAAIQVQKASAYSMSYGGYGPQR